MIPAAQTGLWVAVLTLACSASMAAAEPSLVQTRRIWDQAPHNAFTDMVFFKNAWHVVFREGADHVSPDGAIRVISSTDAEKWASTALIKSDDADLRDPKITIAPGNSLMLTAAGAIRQPGMVKHQSLVWHSTDGGNWAGPTKVGDPNLWLWRVTWRDDTAYGIGYDTLGENFIRLYRSKDGRKFETLVETLYAEGHPNETSLVFLPDGACLCLLRRDGEPGSGKLGSARPPYTEWLWKDLGVKIGGPHMLRLPDGRLAAAVRLYDRKVRTSLAWIDPQAGKLTEFLELPSGGDTSYPGLVWRDGLLWVSYYSSHEGKTAIYLAKVRL